MENVKTLARFSIRRDVYVDLIGLILIVNVVGKCIFHTWGIWDRTVFFFLRFLMLLLLTFRLSASNAIEPGQSSCLWKAPSEVHGLHSFATQVEWS